MPPPNPPSFYRDKLLAYRHPPFYRGTEFCPEARPQPIDFFDTHIDDMLALKHVRHLKSLPATLSDIADKALASTSGIQDDEFAFPNRLHEFRTSAMMEANEVAQYHSLGASVACCNLASKIFMSPDQLDCPNRLVWRRDGTVFADEPIQPPPFVVQNYSLCLMDLKEIPADDMSAENRQTVSSLADTHPHFAVGMFFCTNAHSYLRHMGELADSDAFPAVQNSLVDGRLAPRRLSRYPADAAETIWDLPLAAPNDDNEMSRRANTEHLRARDVRQAKSLGFWPNPRDFLQKVPLPCAMLYTCQQGFTCLGVVQCRQNRCHGYRL